MGQPTNTIWGVTAGSFLVQQVAGAMAPSDGAKRDLSQDGFAFPTAVATSTNTASATDSQALSTIVLKMTSGEDVTVPPSRLSNKVGWFNGCRTH